MDVFFGLVMPVLAVAGVAMLLAAFAVTKYERSVAEAWRRFSKKLGGAPQQPSNSVSSPLIARPRVTALADDGGDDVETEQAVTELSLEPSSDATGGHEEEAGQPVTETSSEPSSDAGISEEKEQAEPGVDAHTESPLSTDDPATPVSVHRTTDDDVELEQAPADTPSESPSEARVSDETEPDEPREDSEDTEPLPLAVDPPPPPSSRHTAADDTEPEHPLTDDSSDSPSDAGVREEIEPDTSAQDREGVFISYRRRDTQHIAGRMYDRLVARYGSDKVFKDVDSIPLGVDFREHVAEQIASCKVAIILIGPRFAGTNPDGDRRIDQPNDHLRIEVRSVLDSAIPVIPVLLDGAGMPSEADLPSDISAISFRHGVTVREDPFFHGDFQFLIKGLDRIMEQVED